MLRKIFALCCFFLSVLSHINAEDSDGEDHVVVLTDATFNDFISKNDKVMVEFYAPWCGHCKRLEPEYKKAAAELKRAKAKMILAKVDATAEKQTGQKFEISGYPTIKVFNKGQASDYKGGRTSNDITLWVLKRENPNVMELGPLGASEQRVKDFTSGKDFYFVAYLRERSKKIKKLREAAQELVDEKESFGLVVVTDTLDEKMEYHRPSFTNPHDKKVVEYTGKISASALKEFFLEQRYPLIHDGEWESEMYAQVPPGRHTAVVVVDDKDDKDAKEKIYKALESTLLELRKPKDLIDRVYFTYVKLSDAPEYLGVKSSNEIMLLDRTPKKMGPNEEKPTKYRLTAPLTEERIKSFFADWKAKKLPVYRRSSEAPEPQSAKDVKVVVANNFEDIVMDPSKDVFVKYYAPWCGHCKKLEPEWKKLAETVHVKYKNVVIAKVDATVNDVDEDVAGFPTLTFYPAGSKSKKLRKRVKYESGARDYKALLEFVEDNAETLAGGSDEL